MCWITKFGLEQFEEINIAILDGSRSIHVTIAIYRIGCTLDPDTFALYLAR